MDIRILSNNIRRTRVLKELTQENVANDLGISLTAYGRIEQGKTDISYSRLCQIADYFQVGVGAFLHEETTMLNSINDSQHYQYKNKEIHRLEKEIEEMKLDVKLIKTHLFGLPT